MEPEVDWGAARAAMVRDQLERRGIRDERVLAAMRTVPRERFVPVEERAEAYADRALAIGYGQTISQPYIVALSLERLALRPSERLLEVGAGSGYAAAVAAQLVAEVVAVERIEALAARASATLTAIGVRNVRVLAADASRGVPLRAPYDAILVSAAASRLPMRLYHELAEHGRMLAPIGGPEEQRLDLVRRGPDGPVVSEGESCRFVPFVGG